VEISNLKRA